MTFLIHDTQLPPHPDARMAVVYYDESQDSMATLRELSTPDPDARSVPPIKAIRRSRPYHTLPEELHPYVPGPPQLGDTTWPRVVAVYEGDVVSWAGHQPHLIQAWVTQPDTVGAYLTRSATRTEALDRGDITTWHLEGQHRGFHTPA